MPAPRLAAWLDSYRLGLKEALHRGAADGFRLLEANAARGELDPRQFGASARRHLLRYTADLGTELAALSLDFPDLGLADPRHGDERLDQLRRTLQMCADLRVRRAAVTLAGFQQSQTLPLAREALATVADWADRAGVTVTVRTGADDPAKAAEFIRARNCPALRLGLDTAGPTTNLRTVAALADLAALVQCRDVRRIGGQVEEVPFGAGEVDFVGWLAALEEGGYDDPLVVRRDAPEAGIDALRQGREHIASLLRSAARP